MLSFFSSEILFQFNSIPCERVSVCVCRLRANTMVFGVNECDTFNSWRENSLLIFFSFHFRSFVKCFIVATRAFSTRGRERERVREERFINGTCTHHTSVYDFKPLLRWLCVVVVVPLILLTFLLLCFDFFCHHFLRLLLHEETEPHRESKQKQEKCQFSCCCCCCCWICNNE